MAQLLVVQGDGTERTVDLADRPVTFGRADDNDVVLTEQKASRRHCTVRAIEGVGSASGGWRVVDEGSANGTWLGGKPVLSARLQPGDEIEIGDTVIQFSATAEETPKAEAIRRRRTPKAEMPWGAVIGAVVIAVGGWMVAGKFADDAHDEAAAAWRQFAQLETDRAIRAKDDDGFRAVLGEAIAAARAAPDGAAAVKSLEDALRRGRGVADPAAGLPEWRKSLDRLEQSRARMTATERRTRLRELLDRSMDDPVAVASIAGALRSDQTSTRERAEAEASRLREDAEKAESEGEIGRAIESWAGWFAAAPHVERDDEKSAAARIASLRDRAQKEADDAVRRYEEQMKDGRLAAATAAADAAAARLRGSGWDVWISARTRRGAAPSGGGAPGEPVARGPSAEEKRRAEQGQKDRVARTLKSAEDLARRRRFADAAVLLRESAADVTDPALRAYVDGRIADLGAEADLVSALLSQIRADAAPFGAVTLASGPVTVRGAGDASVQFTSKAGDLSEVSVAELSGDAFHALLGKAKLEPAQWITCALLLYDLGESAPAVSWMRKALADPAAQVEASAVWARLRGETLPTGGYVPHPKDERAILSAEELRRLQNDAKIRELTAKLGKLTEKVAASKQLKSVEKVAEAHAKLELARAHALELIFDEKKYFYPYRTRMGEYAPVQKEVEDRVKLVREAWEDKSSAKIRPSPDLEKLLAECDDMKTEIDFLGGDVDDAVWGPVDRLRLYLGDDGKGVDLTVQNYFSDAAGAALHRWNGEILAYNAALKGNVTEGEREQVRITNEYRRMMGNRRMLRIHEKLVLAARGHSDDMAREGFFDHFSPIPGKREPGDRMRLAGYPNQPCSENIAMVGGDPQSAFDGWFHSSGHHRNMLMPNWSELGTGQSGRHWTQNFGYCSGDDKHGGPGPQ